jgi:uncharacterized membrane protein
MSRSSRKKRNQSTQATRRPEGLPEATARKLEALPPEQREVVREITREIRISEQTAGSIMPPTMLAAYDTAVPNGAERVLAMAERQQSHRHELESTVINGDSRRADHGLYIGGAIIIVSIICGSVLVALGKDAQGLLIGVGSIIAALGSFIWGWKKRQEQVKKIRGGE